MAQKNPPWQSSVAQMAPERQLLGGSRRDDTVSMFLQYNQALVFYSARSVSPPQLQIIRQGNSDGATREAFFVPGQENCSLSILQRARLPRTGVGLGVAPADTGFLFVSGLFFFPVWISAIK